MEEGRVMEQKVAHLTFIQGIITRMGQNSFLLKGWSVTIIAALFALAAQGVNGKYILVAYFPAIMFWLLDAFFLYQEKLFRKLYEKVASNEVSSEHFTLNTVVVKSEVEHYANVAFSKTLLPFYGCIIGVLLFVMFGIQ
jgi:hypothetical protein